MQNLSFNTWLEIVELKKPVNKVVKSNVIRNKGTNVAKSVIQFRWVTQLGNVVKLIFAPSGYGYEEEENSYVVSFYVNDTMLDDELNQDNQNKKRDPEILAGVAYLLKTKADQLNAKELTFSAFQSKTDEKKIVNIDPNLFRDNAINQLKQLSQIINNHQPQLIPPSQSKIDTWLKFKKTTPPPTYDLNKESWIEWINKLISDIQNNYRIDGYIQKLRSIDSYSQEPALNSYFPYFNNLVAILDKFNDAVASNSPEGLQKTKNRRAVIYKKLIDKYLSDDWNVSIRGTSFTLIRK